MHRATASAAQIDAYPQRFHNIRAPAKARNAPVAVLGHPNPRAGHNKRGCSGNVKGSGRISAGAAGIDEHLAVGSRVGSADRRRGAEPGTLLPESLWQNR